MQDVTRNSYSLYKRESGNRTIWYVRFWDDQTQAYTSGRSTGQTTKAAAHRQVQKWLAEGLPEAQKKDAKATRNRLMGAITKYLEDCEVIKKGEVHETGEVIKLFYTQVTNSQMSSGEQFVDYLARFWDWNGDYVQGRLERKKTIGKKYVEDCHAKIGRFIEPYFKDTLLCDIATKSLEQFMKSIPRRDSDPKNGYARRTINIIMKLIKKALKEAVRLEMLPRNPADGIELLADDRRERGILTTVNNLRALPLNNLIYGCGETALAGRSLSGEPPDKGVSALPAALFPLPSPSSAAHALLPPSPSPLLSADPCIPLPRDSYSPGIHTGSRSPRAPSVPPGSPPS